MHARRSDEPNTISCLWKGSRPTSAPLAKRSASGADTQTPALWASSVGAIRAPRPTSASGASAASVTAAGSLEVGETRSTPTPAAAHAAGILPGPSSASHSLLSGRSFSPFSADADASRGSAFARLRPKSALRGKVFSEVKMRAVSTVLQGYPRAQPGAVTPSEIEARLVEELQLITGDVGSAAAATGPHAASAASAQQFRILAAHRAAFGAFIATQDSTAAALLNRIRAAYEEVELHRFQNDQAVLARRATAAEQRMRVAEAACEELRLQAEHQRLQIENLRRQLNAKNELLSQISSTHKINLSAVNWVTGVESKVGGSASSAGAAQPGAVQRTMAEIRTVQKRVTAAYGEATRRAQREEEGAMMELRREVENDQDRHDMLLVEEQLADARALGGRPAVELRAAAAAAASIASAKDASEASMASRSGRSLRSGGGGNVSNVSVLSAASGDAGAGVSAALSTAEIYRRCQRIENIGVELEPPHDKDQQHQLQHTATM